MLELRTRAAAALLLAAPPAVLTSHTAAWLHGCSAAADAPVHVLTSYQHRHRCAGVAFHQGSVAEQDVVELDGLRALSLEVAVAELLCTAHRPTALAIADQALARLDPTLRAEFKAEVAYRIGARPDPRGRRRAGVLLDLATGLPESAAESHLLLVLFDAGLPVPEPQVGVRDLDGRERYRLDFAWQGPMVALEYDGYEAHVDRAELDAARDLDLTRRGWLVLRATADDLRDPGPLVTKIQKAFVHRGRRSA